MLNYPHIPGHKVLGTSLDAAVSMESRAGTLRKLVLDTLRNSPLRVTGWTADEMAEYLNESILSIRPRFTELKQLNEIHDTGVRRKNLSGRNAVVWHYLKPGEQLGLI